MHIWPSIPSQFDYKRVAGASRQATHFDPANDLRGYFEGLTSQIEMLRRDRKKFVKSENVY